MEIIKEYEENGYINFEISVSEEEKKILEDVCKENNTDINGLVGGFINWSINNPETFEKWIKENRTDKCEEGIIGKPLFDYDDEVGFYLIPYKGEKEVFCKGKVMIIDAFGTIEQNVEPSYDIMVENYNNSGERCLVKHVRESSCYNLCKKIR